MFITFIRIIVGRNPFEPFSNLFLCRNMKITSLFTYCLLLKIKSSNLIHVYLPQCYNKELFRTNTLSIIVVLLGNDRSEVMQQCIKLVIGHPICPKELVRVLAKIRICTEIFSFCMDILIKWMYPIFSMN